MDPISILGILLSLGIAFWQYRRAEIAERKLNEELKKVPSDVLDQIGMTVTTSSNVKVLEPGSQPIKMASISFVDVNYDSRNELLVQHPTGNHGTLLKIYGFVDSDFHKLAELGCGTPEGFRFYDYDGDGKIEIVARETDWSAGQSYVDSPRMSIIYKWKGNDFVQVGEIKDRLNVSLKNINKLDSEEP
jgi:hypothetical protein